MKNKKNEYSADAIQVLEGLEPVRKRPGMYIGSTGSKGLHHLIYEVVDNSLDEAIGGFADHIKVSLLKDNMVRVEDNGRGIPVDIHEKTKKSALETILTTLHAGGKFGGSAYKISGGLHGVGISVVCALSTYLKAEVKKDGGIFIQEYDTAVPRDKVKKIGETKETGTSITFKPDNLIFKEINFNRKAILDHLRQQAYLTKGIRIDFYDLRDEENPFEYHFYFEGGIKAYLNYLIRDIKILNPNPFYVSKEKDGVLVEVALQYIDEIEPTEESFTNNIFTEEGGMHLTGFRTALTRLINEYAKKLGILKNNEKLSGDDVREGLVAVVSIKIVDPQFEGQTKSKLGNPEARTAVEAVTGEALADFLDKYARDTRIIIEKSLLSAKARQAARAARETVLRKGILEGLSLPGKLADCTSKKPEESELYLVEGDSAGGSSRQARDRRFQAILSLKGKILNVERVRIDKMLASAEIKNLIIAMGTAVAEDFNIEKLRYHRIIIMCDADSDGNHIKTLILTLFFRYFKEIIDNGYLYIAKPPLYKIQIGKEAKYAYSDEEKDNLIKNIKKFSIQRYKGLGEMNPEQLWETTMDPKKRVLVQVTIEDAQEADKVFDTLMGKEVAPRKRFIQLSAKNVRNLDV
ncbi:MAG: DNA topoisomerase (ATP-hydrolyzing) subunit B [Candidatus Pacebacteria bacterium]|nr:DNA topoisomerase (ATP-hydrolyzing) subunit B [Candidatus Paceibacterota bacterium]MDD2796798.1 DNA topoisomerase (ATP-hydrolyzing) subunit B [Candidatus Paceibacterota bacterium]MDD3047933.1 DNA topoisomerase (ATP-hydrolyzing) subunit B [Candidatus Paceibacterota bacterium]MDD3510024.1 DNA topoisomerase (ATP-hydrolyzing) subunit B [Candidatus Paceibacterota bacterium]MDD3918493.1 DNA topoisomerase (ATP-hydrolyzing) subunit B [Candidatus Paceibacterota bacterium]